MSMKEVKSKSARVVQAWLNDRGHHFNVVEMSQTTRTAIDAAHTIGCEVGQIVKSLLFKTVAEQKPILVLASGPNQVDTDLVAAQVGEPIEKADAKYTQKTTGFAIGGVPPVAHKEKLPTFIDEDLLRFKELWAAAGTPHSVFNLKAEEIQKLTEGTVMSMKQTGKGV
jgi:prolyl-tRNA editing enzyme YbaK/EbsC (Cys-tRNA(Pro) deacylase)